MNTAMLTGRQVSQSMKIFMVSEAGSVADVTLHTSCSTADHSALKVEMFYLNTIEQLFLFVEKLYQLKVCLPCSRLLTGILILAVFQNLGWNSNKTYLLEKIK